MNRVGASLIIMLLMLSFTASSNKVGLASWYGGGESLNTHTASGELFDSTKLTCAMPSYSFGSYYKVCNVENDKCVVVKHNDYGPASKYVEQGRVIDLSREAFKRIANLKKGLIWVSIDKIQTTDI